MGGVQLLPTCWDSYTKATGRPQVHKEGAQSLHTHALALRIDSPIVIRFAIWTEIESLSVESIRIDSRL